MSKQAEIDYIQRVVSVEDFTLDQMNDYLMRKPFPDDLCGEYLLDIAQITKLMPLPPARILDVGVGSGWTSELFARQGYEVVGLDISPDMIALAKQRSCPGLSFQVCDYEAGDIPKGFDIAVIYDALHHSEDTCAVIKNIFESLVDGGRLITIEPGKGHSTALGSIEVMRKYGTTEKDMPASLQHELMIEAGFGIVRQYIRLSQLPLDDISTVSGALAQGRRGISLAYESVMGMSSVVMAIKSTHEPARVIPIPDISRSLLNAASVYDAEAEKSQSAE